MSTPETSNTIREVTPAALKELSPLARRLREDFIEDVKKNAQGFYDDINSDTGIPGFGNRQDAMKYKKIDYGQALIGQHFNRLVDGVVDNFDRSLLVEDKKYREECAHAKSDEEKVKLEEKYSGRYEKLWDLSSGELGALITDVEALGKQAENPGEFVEIYFPQLQKMSVEAQTRSFEDAERILAEADKTGEFDLEYADNAYQRAQEILEKMNAGTELEKDDYEELLTQLSPFFDTQYPKDKEGQKASALRGTESSGAIIVLHGMTPAERMEFGKYLVESDGREPYEKRQGILSLASANYLTISQVDTLFSKIPDLDALSQDEKNKIEVGQKIFKELQEQAAERMKQNPSSNLLNQYFTGSNVLIYEVIGRIAVVGMAISLALNLKNIPNTVCDPIFLAMAATAGLSYDHITGGVGKGGISQFVAGIQMNEPEEKAPEKIQMERLTELMGSHMQATQFLRENNGARLSQILNIAEIKSKKDPGDYIFSFDDLIEDELEKENAEEWSEAKQEERKKELEAEYKKGMDGKTVPLTENGITLIYQLMRKNMGLMDLEEMLEIFDSADEQLGIVT